MSGGGLSGVAKMTGGGCPGGDLSMIFLVSTCIL